MSRLPKEYSDRIKRGQGWKCGNRKCTHGQGEQPASIKSGGQIHHRDGDKTNDNYSNLVALCAKCHRNNYSNLVALCAKCHRKIRTKRDWYDRLLWG